MSKFAVFLACDEDGIYSQESIWFDTKPEADKFMADKHQRSKYKLWLYVFERHLPAPPQACT